MKEDNTSDPYTNAVATGTITAPYNHQQLQHQQNVVIDPVNHQLNQHHQQSLQASQLPSPPLATFQTLVRAAEPKQHIDGNNAASKDYGARFSWTSSAAEVMAPGSAVEPSGSMSPKTQNSINTLLMTATVDCSLPTPATACIAPHRSAIADSVSNLLPWSCAVCGDLTTGEHYRVYTCEACKSFFRRSIQFGRQYECTDDQNCVVDKIRRVCCRFCRFQKCLQVGMIKEMVRTGSMKGLRGRLQSEQGRITPPVLFITKLVQAYINTIPRYSSMDYSQYFEPMPLELLTTKAEAIQQFYRLLTMCQERIRNFAEMIPGFKTLQTSDKNVLFYSAYLELFVLRLAYRTNNAEAQLIFCNGVVLHKQQCHQSFGNWLQAILDFSQSLHSLDIDVSSFACLCALTLISERHGLRELNKTDKIHVKIITTLRQYLKLSMSDSQRKSNYLLRLLDKLTELRSLTIQGIHRISHMKLEDIVPTPPFIENILVNSFEKNNKTHM